MGTWCDYGHKLGFQGQLRTRQTPRRTKWSRRRDNASQTSPLRRRIPLRCRTVSTSWFRKINPIPFRRTKQCVCGRFLSLRIEVATFELEMRAATRVKFGLRLTFPSYFLATHEFILWPFELHFPKNGCPKLRTLCILPVPFAAAPLQRLFERPCGHS